MEHLTEINRLDFIDTLKIRFLNHMNRHPKLTWDIVNKQLLKSNKLETIYLMEKTGGEPDVVELETYPNDIVFIDCSPESPLGRRSLCYDEKARLMRKKFPPKDSALHLAQTIGIDMLDEDLYRSLQAVGPFDMKTSSWIKTPESIRNLKGALFCDYRYGHTFTYHNGADSYYESRGFRGMVKL